MRPGAGAGAFVRACSRRQPGSRACDEITEATRPLLMPERRMLTRDVSPGIDLAQVGSPPLPPAGGQPSAASRHTLSTAFTKRYLRSVVACPQCLLAARA